jgi:hypothetical protein
MVRESALPDPVQTKSKRSFRAAGGGRSTFPLIPALESARKRRNAHNWPQANATLLGTGFFHPTPNNVLPHFISSGTCCRILFLLAIVNSNVSIIRA